jgi:hypothetical protein
MGRVPKPAGDVTQFTFFAGDPQKKNAVAGDATAFFWSCCDYGRFVEQVMTNVPGEPGTATEEHLADLASATPTMAN